MKSPPYSIEDLLYIYRTNAGKKTKHIIKEKTSEQTHLLVACKLPT